MSPFDENDVDFHTRLIKLEAKMTRLEPIIERLDAVATKFEGMGTLIKVGLWLAVPVIAFLAWVRDHVKF